MSRRLRFGCLLTACLSVAVTTSCGHPRESFATLTAEAAAIPVPPGVVFVNETRVVNNGPGFTTKTYRQVHRQYASSLSCAALEAAWTSALTAQGKRFTVQHGSAFSDEDVINIAGARGFLGVNLGGANGTCPIPLVFALSHQG